MTKVRKPGDKVRLAGDSGSGPIMTVKIHEAERSDGYDNHPEQVICDWHDKDDKPHQQAYAPGQLIDA